MHTFVILMVALSLAAAPVWARQGEDDMTKMKNMGVHGPVSRSTRAPGEEPGLASVLKKSKLSKYPSKTIGAAFDDYRYFVKREWRETPSSRGKIYVDFTGWLKIDLLDVNAIKNGISSRAVGIKFLVNPDGSYGAVMVSRIEIRTDGKMYSQPMEGLDDILNKIYANKEIRF